MGKNIGATTMVLSEQGIIDAIQEYLETRCWLKHGNQYARDNCAPKISLVQLRPARPGRNENEIIVLFEAKP